MNKTTDKKKFEYKGLTFEPLKDIYVRGSEEEKFQKITRRCVDYQLTPEGWNYDEFYKIAEQNDAVADIYNLIDRNYPVIPSTNYLFYYNERN
jgi:hypothetical protein